MGNASKASKGEVRESLRRRKSNANRPTSSLQDIRIGRSTKGTRRARRASKLDGLEALTLLEVLQAVLVVRKALFLAVQL